MTTHSEAHATSLIHAGHDCRELADRYRPTLMELRDEGVTGHAAVCLYAGRDALHLGDTAEQVRDLLVRVERANPVRVEDVWPDGVPGRWVDWSEFDPSDAELVVDWAGEGWSERNARVMRLVADIESGAA